jgi:hypothetical protein
MKLKSQPRWPLFCCVYFATRAHIAYYCSFEIRKCDSVVDKGSPIRGTFNYIQYVMRHKRNVSLLGGPQELLGEFVMLQSHIYSSL